MDVARYNEEEKCNRASGPANHPPKSCRIHRQSLSFDERAENRQHTANQKRWNKSFTQE